MYLFLRHFIIIIIIIIIYLFTQVHPDNAVPKNVHHDSKVPKKRTQRRVKVSMLMEIQLKFHGWNCAGISSNRTKYPHQAVKWLNVSSVDPQNLCPTTVVQRLI